MMDTVETLIQAAGADEHKFRELAAYLGAPDRLSDLLVGEATRVQGSNPLRARQCAAVIDRLLLGRRAV